MTTTEKTAEFFKDQTWLIYGKFAVPKKDAKEAIQSRGGRVVSSVSKKLNFLVWSGETLGPDDEISSVKPRDTLQVGGLVVGEADFQSLLKGTVPPRLAQLLSVQKTANPRPETRAKSKKAKSKKQATTELAPDSLLARTQEALAAMQVGADGPPIEPWASYTNAAAALDAAALACVEVGQGDRARALVASARPELRACAVKIALSINEGLDEAIDTVLEGVQCADSGEAYDTTVNGWAAARALVLSAAIEGKSERSAELARPADEIVDGFFAGERSYKDLSRVLQTQLALGKRQEARRVLKKWFRQDAESVGEALGRGPVLVTTFSDDAEMTLRLIQSIDSSHDRMHVVERFVAQFAGWSFEDLDKLMHMVEHQAWPVYQMLREAGRHDEARRVLSEFEPHENDHRGQVERYLALGDEEAAARLIRAHANDDVVLAVMGLQQGLDTFEATWPRHAKPEPEAEVMTAVTDLITLGEYVLEQGYDRGRYQPLLDAVEGLLAADFRTSYDRGVEQGRRLRWTALQTSIREAEGNAEAWQEMVKTETKRFKEFAAFASDSDARNDVAKMLVKWAIQASAPDLALKAAKKITARLREDVAIDVGRAFLPGSPAQALAALESLAGKSAHAKLLGARNSGDGTLLVDGSAEGTILAPLWAAALR